jgi:putative sigma-54 modulation protein
MDGLWPIAAHYLALLHMRHGPIAQDYDGRTRHGLSTLRRRAQTEFAHPVIEGSHAGLPRVAHQPNHRNPFLEGGLMNLTISGHHLEVTPSIREYVLTKLDRVTRHFDQVVDIAVLLTVEKQKEKDRRQRAEVNLHVKGRDIFVETAHEDLYAAIDELVDKLDRQVCRHKSRVQDHHHVSQKREMLN